MAGWHLSATVSHLGASYSDIENTRELTSDGEAGKVPSNDEIAMPWQSKRKPWPIR